MYFVNCTSDLLSYEVEVEGTDIYLVEVKLDSNNNIVGTSCDCPYDMGEYCKHQVAVFYAFAKYAACFLAGTGDGACSNNKFRVNSSELEKQDLQQILSVQSKEELVAFYARWRRNMKRLKED